jgi:hypothetical protein
MESLSTSEKSQIQAVLDERAVIDAVCTYDTTKIAALEALVARVGVSNIYKHGPAISKFLLECKILRDPLYKGDATNLIRGLKRKMARAAGGQNAALCTLNEIRCLVFCVLINICSKSTRQFERSC